ncbi:MAG: hypothetical protein GXO47_05125 [Chlorobi bacterium]|nr:hypothetical protein [Chlorobiota bacterium]
MKKSILLLFTATLVFTSVIYAKDADLSLRLKKGETYEITTNMRNTINQEMMGQLINVAQNMTATVLMKVKDKLPNGSYIIEQSYKRITLNINSNGQTLSYDTDNEADNGSPLAMVKNIIGPSVQYEVTPDGEISNISGLDEMLNKIGGSQQQQMMSGVVSKESLLSFYNYLPKEKVKEGLSYSKKINMKEMLGTEVTVFYTVAKITDKNITLNVNSDIKFNPDKPIENNGMKVNMKGDGKQTGKYIISANTGMPETMEIDQTINMTMSMKNPQTDKIISLPIKTNSIVKTTVIKK